jgi:hypothetical protein
VAFNLILLYAGTVYWITAVVVYREAKRLVAAQPAV